MSTPISSGFTYRENNLSFTPPSMVEQLVNDVVEKVVADQAVAEQLLEQALETTLTSVVDWEFDYNWRVYLAQLYQFPSSPLPLTLQWGSG